MLLGHGNQSPCPYPRTQRLVAMPHIQKTLETLMSRDFPSAQDQKPSTNCHQGLSTFQSLLSALGAKTDCPYRSQYDNRNPPYPPTHTNNFP